MKIIKGLSLIMLVYLCSAQIHLKKCSEEKFCARNRAIFSEIEDVKEAYFSYSVDKKSLAIRDNTITADLKLSCEDSLYIAKALKLEINIYEDGIMRVLINEIHVNSNRFRYSEHDTGASVEVKNLKPVSITSVYSRSEDQIEIDYESNDEKDEYEYIIRFSPFRIEQKINQITTVIVNDKDTLFFEDYQHFEDDHNELTSQDIKDDCFYKLIDGMTDKQKTDFFGANFMRGDGWIKNFVNSYKQEERNMYSRESYMLGFYFASQHIFGLPERSDKFLLKTTEGKDPYRLYSVDLFPHDEFNQQGLYSGIPYLTGHSKNHDESLIWMNPSDTFVDILDYNKNKNDKKQGRLINMISESGMLEFFLIGSASDTAPKQVQKLLQTITGFQRLPPFFSIGFHYSKWEDETTAERIVWLNDKFEESNIPLDVVWSDLPYSDGRKYFIFNPRTFNSEQLEAMKSKLEMSSRKMVVITDPHIKADNGFPVFSDGLKLDMKTINGSVNSIFVKSKNMAVFKGHCWPGQSSWIDYLNEGGQQYWTSRYSYDKFKGTSDLFHIWIDMNEPSVFGGEEGTLPKDSWHVLSDGTKVHHKDVHNAYGLLMSKATYNGIYERDSKQQRPFVLTRSAFFGTQKYAAKWTGDNRAYMTELSVSINQMLSLGISGVQFVGADIPGFWGSPSQELYILFYQLGMFYPFMRAHGHIDFKNREPFNQKENVQKAIREAIFLRYDLIHYLYTQFYIASTEGTPIMRPMWQEFPSDENTFEIQDQFMFGDRILAAPKIKSEGPKKFIWGGGLHQIDLYLPKDERWYFYYTKLQEPTRGLIKDRSIEEHEQGIYVKGGSIIPIKLHNNRLSLLRAFMLPVRLDIYLDNRQKADGLLYLDDGESFRYETHKEKTLIRYTFENNVLSYQVMLRDHYYEMAFDIKIIGATIYGLESQPIRVAPLYKSQSVEANDMSYHFDYDVSRQALTIRGLDIPVDDGERNTEDYTEEGMFTKKVFMVEYSDEKAY